MAPDTRLRMVNDWFLVEYRHPDGRLWQPEKERQTPLLQVVAAPKGSEIHKGDKVIVETCLFQQPRVSRFFVSEKDIIAKIETS